MVNRNDREIIHALAAEVAEIAALPVQNEKKHMWSRLNGLKPERPMVMIDQVCWSEMNTGDALTLQCEDRACRDYEWLLRRTLYQWKHFPVDMVVEPFVNVEKAIRNTGLGIVADVEILRTSEANDVVSQHYRNQFERMEDVEKLKTPIISHDAMETARRMDMASDLFNGTLTPRAQGWDPYLSVWDPITTWMGAENVLYALADKPEMMMALAKRLVECYMNMLDQMEEQGLLCYDQSLIHCTGAYTDELPGPGFDKDKPRTKDLWMFGLAQVFSSVSPAMFDAFEVETSMPLFERFGMVYYGCCDPLDKKMEQVRRIPNVRKVSMSPWVSKARGAEEIGGDYVYSFKPNPAFLAAGQFDEDMVRKDLQETKALCDAFGCPLEIILKDISTVAHQPQRLWRWADIAMDVVKG